MAFVHKYCQYIKLHFNSSGLAPPPPKLTFMDKAGWLIRQNFTYTRGISGYIKP